MRQKIYNKFSGLSHKWFLVNLKSHTFTKIINSIRLEISKGYLTSKDAIDLFTSFKEYNNAWVKLKSVKGRNNIKCYCEVSTKDNKKVFLELSPEEVLNSKVLNETPKKLNLYTLGSGYWKIPRTETFVDPIEYPPAEEELTELGYQIYKEWQIEVKNSGMSKEEYYKRKYSPYGGKWCS